MSYWRSIPLKTRLLLTFSVGFILLVSQFFMFSLVALTIGLVLLLSTLLMVEEAPSTPYSDDRKLKLLVAPVFIAGLGAISGYLEFGSLLLAGCTAVLGAGIYTAFIGEIALPFRGWKIYRRFPAYVAALVLCTLSLYIIVMLLTVL